MHIMKRVCMNFRICAKINLSVNSYFSNFEVHVYLTTRQICQVKILNHQNS